jgi:hypothetical protein
MTTQQDVNKAWSIYWPLLLDAVRNNWPSDSIVEVDAAQRKYLILKEQYDKEQLQQGSKITGNNNELFTD